MAIFGYDGRGERMCTLPNFIWGSKFTAPEDGVAQSISVYLDVAAVQKAKCAIYDSAFNLLGVTEERTDMPAYEAWTTFNLLDPKPSVVGGQDYYLVCWSDTSYVRMFYDIGYPEKGCRQPLTYNSFPDPLSPDFIGDRRFSIYCTYTPVAPPVEYTLTISATTGGTTDPAPGSYKYPADTTVPVLAKPYAGYSFDHWLLDGVDAGKDNPINVLMDKDHTLQAVFAEIPPAKGTLDCHAFVDTKEVAASVEIVDVGTYSTPFTVDLNPGTYTLRATYTGVTQERTTTITEGATTREDFVFAAPPPAVEWLPIAIGATSPITFSLAVIAASETSKISVFGS